jgi:hypothetical protein
MMDTPRDRQGFLSTLGRFLPGPALITGAEAMRAYQCDALSAYRELIGHGGHPGAGLAQLSRAPCKGTVFQRVRTPPGNFRSSR